MRPAKVGAALAGATFVNIHEMFGGSLMSYANSDFFYDDIHLNTAGYCTVFTQEAVQKYFGCEYQAYDCGLTLESIVRITFHY